MAVTYLTDGQYIGLSTDTKPVAAPAGYYFKETDTGDTHISDGTYWWLTNYPGPLSRKRVGYIPMGASVTGGVGMFVNFTSSTGAPTFDQSDVTNGRFMLCQTGATSGNKAGSRMVSAALTTKDWNPRMRFTFLVTNNTDHRFWIGFTNQTTELTGEDPLSGLAGVMFGAVAADTNWKILHNDATGATVSDDTGIARGTSIHTVNLVSDHANSRWSWSYDGGAYTHITTEIPLTGVNCTVHMMNETATAAAKVMRIYNLSVQSDK
jgi:hypothetical protein